MASIAPPLLWSLYGLIRTRKLDALSVIVIASIVFSVAATALGGSARMIQIRDALVTGVIGILFLLSLFMEKPLIFYLTRATFARNPDPEMPELEKVWALPEAPHAFRVLTTLWGIGLVAQTTLLCTLAWLWPIGRYLLISPFIGYGFVGALMVCSFWYGGRHKTALASLMADAPPAQASAPEL